MNKALEALAARHNVIEVWEVRRFHVYREPNELLIVEVSDQGAGAGPLRYSARAWPAEDSSSYSQGNPAPSEEEAINAVHWDQI